jgi:hypothetical protein
MKEKPRKAQCGSVFLRFEDSGSDCVGLVKETLVTEPQKRTDGFARCPAKGVRIGECGDMNTSTQTS